MDVICITHGHFDHIHDAVPLAKKFSPQVVAIYETCHWLESQGVKNTRAMNKGGSQQIGPVTVTMTHAVHSCGILDDGKIIYGGEAAGYVLRFADGRSIYFSGDTAVFSDMELIQELYEPTLAFLPIGDLSPWDRGSGAGVRHAPPAARNTHALRHLSVAHGNARATGGTSERHRHGNLDANARSAGELVKRS